MYYQEAKFKSLTERYRLQLVSFGVMMLAGIKPVSWGRPTTWLGWLLLSVWAISYLTLAGIVLTQVNRKVKEVDKSAHELNRERERLEAEYQRFQPDYKQARTYYYNDRTSEGLRERYESISSHQESLRRQIRVIDGLLTEMTNER